MLRQKSCTQIHLSDLQFMCPGEIDRKSLSLANNMAETTFVGEGELPFSLSGVYNLREVFLSK